MDEYTVQLSSQANHSITTLKLGEALDFAGQKYKLKSVDAPKKRVVLRREADGQDFEIGPDAGAAPLPSGTGTNR